MCFSPHPLKSHSSSVLSHIQPHFHCSFSCELQECRKVIEVAFCLCECDATKSLVQEINLNHSEIFKYVLLFSSHALSFQWVKIAATVTLKICGAFGVMPASKFSQRTDIIQIPTYLKKGQPITEILFSS